MIEDVVQPFYLSPARCVLRDLQTLALCNLLVPRHNLSESDDNTIEEDATAEQDFKLVSAKLSRVEHDDPGGRGGRDGVKAVGLLVVVVGVPVWYGRIMVVMVGILIIMVVMVMILFMMVTAATFVLPESLVSVMVTAIVVVVVLVMLVTEKGRGWGRIKCKGLALLLDLRGSWQERGALKQGKLLRTFQHPLHS